MTFTSLVLSQVNFVGSHQKALAEISLDHFVQGAGYTAQPQKKTTQPDADAMKVEFASGSISHLCLSICHQLEMKYLGTGHKSIGNEQSTSCTVW